LIRFDSAYSLFCTAVISFYSLSVLRYLLCLFIVVISVITTSSNHSFSVDFTALLFELPFTVMKAYCYWLKRLCRFQSFTTVKQRLL